MGAQMLACPRGRCFVLLERRGPIYPRVALVSCTYFGFGPTGSLIFEAMHERATGPFHRDGAAHTTASDFPCAPADEHIVPLPSGLQRYSNRSCCSCCGFGLRGKQNRRDGGIIEADPPLRGTRARGMHNFALFADSVCRAKENRRDALLG